MLKRSLVLIAVVAFLVAIPNAQAINYFPSGDMENGGDAVTPPLYWAISGPGTLGVSSDTRIGSGQSLRLEGSGPGTTTKAYDYGSTATWTGTEQLLLGFDAKGDVYVSAFSGGTGGPSIWAQGDDWIHYETWVTPTAGTHGFTFNFWDNSTGGRAAYVDNLFMIDTYTAPDFSLVNNGDMEGGGSPTAAPDYWGGGPATKSASRDIPVPGGGSQSLSILGAGSLGASYSVAYNTVTPETEYEISFWHKGDVYTQQQLYTGGGEVWAKKTYNVTTNPGQTSLSQYFYDWDFEDSLPLLIDNYSLVVVPEPMTMTLLGIGGLAVLIRRRK